MGNIYSAFGRDLVFQADKLGAAMVNSTMFQYVLSNGPGSMFDGYAWSLDTFVDYAYQVCSRAAFFHGPGSAMTVAIYTNILAAYVHIFICYWCSAFPIYGSSLCMTPSFCCKT